MSCFDNPEKDNLFEMIREFLKSHSIKELMEVVTYAVECKENDCL